MVSVIIPTYNYGGFILETIASVQAQSYTDWECIIVDDGSTDNTAEIIKPLLSDTRIKYIYQDNRGLAGARNTGLRKASGTYIQLLDSDDLIEKDKLKRTIAFFEANPEADIVYSDVRYFKNGDPLKLYYNYNCDAGDNTPWMSFITGKGKDLVKVILQGNIMVVSSPIFKAEAIKKSEIFFNEKLKANEDWDFWTRLFLADKHLLYINEPDTKTLIRVHETSMSQDVFKMWVYGLQVLTGNSEKVRNYGLGLQLEKRIDEHKQVLLHQLAESRLQEFEKKIELLKQQDLYDLVFPKPAFLFELTKIYVKLKKFFNA